MRMYKINILIALFCLLINNTAFSDKNKQSWANIMIPIYDFVVVTPVPSDWQLRPAHEQGNDGFYLIEFLPKGQTVHEWSEMITISGHKNIPITPRQYFTDIYVMTQKICGEKNTAATIMLATSTEVVASLMCGEPNSDAAFGGLKRGHGETTLYRIYKEGDSLYSIFHSWRGKSYSVQDKNSNNMPVSTEQINKYISASNSTLMCSRKNPQGKCAKILLRKIE